MRTAMLLPVAVLAGLPAWAGDFSACITIDPPALRLACYDAAAGRPVESPPPAPSADWQLQEWGGELAGKSLLIRRRADLAVQDGYGTSSTPTLIIRCASGETSLFINWGVILGAVDQMLWKVDDGQSFPVGADPSGDGKALFVRHPRVFLVERLIGHGTLYAGVEPRGLLLMETKFRLDGLAEAMRPVAALCGWSL